MKFIHEEKKINCIRMNYLNEGKVSKQTLVTSFDANANHIPAHVSEVLTDKELRKLELWMIERALLKSQLAKESNEESVLRALPGFLQEAIDALDAIDKLSIRQFQLITNKLLELGTKLDGFEKLVPGKSLELDTISNEEILKEQLSDIKKTL